jgi:hypothetical protein
MGLFKDCGCGCDGKKQEKKLLISTMSALLFFIVANPDTFRLMRSILGSWVSGPTGCPTTAGLILHTIVFMLITWGLMNIKSESYAPYESEAAPVKMQMPMGPSPMQMPMGPSPMQMPRTMGPSPPRMVDMPLPTPGMSEKSYDLFDSGIGYAPMDINGDMDAPMDIKKQSGAVTCSCTDGRNVVITP